MKIVNTLIALLALAGVATAHSYDVGPVHIGHPYAAPTAPGQPNGAAYLTIETKGPDADRLVSLSSPIADAVEMHDSDMSGGMAHMAKLDGVDVKPGAPVSFSPGHRHIMLIGLKGPLKEGDRQPLTLTFEHAGSVTVELFIEKPKDGDKPMGDMKM